MQLNNGLDAKQIQAILEKALNCKELTEKEQLFINEYIKRTNTFVLN